MKQTTPLGWEIRRKRQRARHRDDSRILALRWISNDYVSPYRSPYRAPVKCWTALLNNPPPVTQGNYAEAEPRFRRSLAVAENGLGPEHPTVGTTLSNLGELLKSQVGTSFIGSNPRKHMKGPVRGLAGHFSWLLHGACFPHTSFIAWQSSEFNSMALPMFSVCV